MFNLFNRKPVDAIDDPSFEESTFVESDCAEPTKEPVAPYWNVYRHIYTSTHSYTSSWTELPSIEFAKEKAAEYVNELTIQLENGKNFIVLDHDNGSCVIIPKNNIDSSFVEVKEYPNG